MSSGPTVVRIDRRLLAIVLLGLVPWTVTVADTVTFATALALVDPATWTLTTVWDYYFRYTAGLPGYLLAWPLGTCLYLGALASAVAGAAAGVEDRRVTAGLLVFAGVTQVTMAHGISRQPGRFALPVGTVLCFAVAWWFDWPAIRRAVGLSSE